MDLWPPFSGFLDLTHTDTPYDTSGRVISPSQSYVKTEQGNSAIR
jgi:hypothetical protein